MDGPTDVELWRLAQELRRANTNAFPISVAEAVQHAIVRLEQLAASGALPDEEAREHYRRGCELHASLLRPAAP